MKTFKDIREVKFTTEAYFQKELEPYDYMRGSEKMYVDIIKKNGGKNIKVYKPTRQDPQLGIDFEGGNIKKISKELEKRGDGTETIDEKVKDGKVDALSKMGKQKLTSLEISNYYKDNPSQKKAARDKDVKKGIELALDLGGAQTYAVKELEKFKRGLSKHPAVKKALQHANEQVESLEEKISPKEFSKLRGTYKDKISGAIIEFDSQGFVVEPKNGKVVPFEWKNMMAEAVSPAQQAAIAIAKKEKGEKSKTEDKGQFIYAAKQAKKKGETTFVFAGKTYNCEEVLEDKEICPKCEGKGCDHCDDIGYHEAHKKGSKCKTESFTSFVSEEVANITVDPRNKLNSGQQQSYYAMEIVKNARRFGLKGAVMHKHIRIKGPKKKVNDFLRTVIGKSSYGDPTEKDMTTPQVDKMLNKGMKGRNEEKLNEATVIPQVKDIVSKKQAKKIQGVMVDMFTASAISQIYDKVNDTNKAKMDKLKITQLANLAMKLMKKEETELEEKRFSAKRDAMKDMGKSGKDSADDDDYKATDDDRKAASKNVISQIRRGCDMPKGVMVKFKDGSSKNFPKKACQLVMTKFDSIKKPMVKKKFQDMVNQSFAGLKKALSMKG